MVYSWQTSPGFDKRDSEFKKEKIATFDGEKLLGLYIGYYNHFDPLGEEYSETFHLLEDEILKRCKL